jgi:hypothetical protein
MNYKRLFSRYFWNDLWYKITAFFNPRQKWLTKLISNQWMDKPELIKDILFACLVHYVEEEKGINSRELYETDYKEGHISKEYLDHCIEVNTDLQNVYNYIKMERPKIELVIEREWKTNSRIAIKMESEMSDNDVWAMTTIAKYSPYLWT